MKQTFYSNGKLLITGEYLVLDGAKAFALIWTKFNMNGLNKEIHGLAMIMMAVFGLKIPQAIINLVRPEESIQSTYYHLTPSLSAQSKFINDSQG
jgi:hypothetical protein